MSHITVVVAANKNFLIGQNGKLPWSLKSDMAAFRAVTANQNIVMGKNTWESIPGDLPGRNVHVFSKTITPNPEKFQKLTKFKEIDMLENPVIVGGVELYNRFIPRCDELYITRVDCDEYNGKRINPINFDRFILIGEYPIMNLDDGHNSHRHVIQHYISKRYFKQKRIDEYKIISWELSVWNDIEEGLI